MYAIGTPWRENRIDSNDYLERSIDLLFFIAALTLFALLCDKDIAWHLSRFCRWFGASLMM